MRIALVHDWLNGMRGGEKVLELLCEIFPWADLYTLLCEPSKIDTKIIQNRRVQTSWLQRSSLARRHYRYLLPLLPAAIEKFSLDSYDLVISSSHCVAKGVRAPKHATHISYCHTPMRYLWDFQEEYFGSGGAKRLLLAPLLNRLRHWDVESSARVNHFIANSRFVADRIARVYGRSSEVIHPPVDTAFFTPSTPAGKPGDYFLMVTALVPYKKVELVLEVFRQRLHEPLVIIGTGPKEKALRQRASQNVRFLGWASPTTLRDWYRGCRALIFPQKEDFGIVPLEVQACGRPVIAFGEGGALETIVAHPQGHLPKNVLRAGLDPTGMFFPAQTAESLTDAISVFQKLERSFHPHALRQNAIAFDKDACREKLKNFITSKAHNIQAAITANA